MDILFPEQKHKYIFAFIIILVIVGLIVIFIPRTHSTFLGIRKPRAVVYLFYRPGCPWCDKMKPAWDEFTRQAPFDISVEKINVLEEKDLAESFGVNGVPHVVKVENDKKIVYSGDRTTEDLLAFANKA